MTGTPLASATFSAKVSAEAIQLLSTDFDGTLIGLGGRGRCIPILAEALDAVHTRGITWVVNTGRSLDFAIVGLEEFGSPWIPSFLVVNERHVFGRVGSDWHALADWNKTCDLAHESLFSRSRGLLAEIRLWVAATPGVSLIPDPMDPEGIVTADEDVMDRVVAFLTSASAEYPDFAWQRNTIYLRFCHTDYHKGSALDRLSRELGLHAGQILAAGDHHNDLSMLNPAVASMLACPGNAVEEVRQAVRDAGGFPSQHLFGMGTAEGIFHFLEKP